VRPGRKFVGHAAKLPLRVWPPLHPQADFTHEEEGEDIHCSDVLRTEVTCNFCTEIGLCYRTSGKSVVVECDYTLTAVNP
jgi:hypothetical protein